VFHSDALLLKASHIGLQPSPLFGGEGGERNEPGEGLGGDHDCRNYAGHDNKATSAFLVPMPVIITAKRPSPCSMMRAVEPWPDVSFRAANTRTGCASILEAANT